jgi:hypothetical protein
MVQDEANGEIVAVGGASREKKLNFFQRIALFIRQVFAELRKVVTRPVRSSGSSRRSCWDSSSS